jgi:DNA-directed RNA polymerase specialized sigma subunit
MTKAERDDLILAHRGVARNLAFRLFIALPSRFEFDDLTQEAMVALTECADRFDPARGLPFGSLVGFRIMSALLAYVAAEDQRRVVCA